MRGPAYYRRVLAAYLGRGPSQLSFWHERPEIEPAAFAPGARAYYMTFAGKARYAGPFDAAGIPQLDYRGAIGRQYNPIAVAQYGLARWNAFARGAAAADRAAAVACADWLVASIERTAAGTWMWPHRFDWEYFRTLRAPWYSGLAQGQGLSLLARVGAATGDARYADAAARAFAALAAPLEEGGTLWRDAAGDPWIEEYRVDPPTHILNGFLWALWGVRDHARASGDPRAAALWDAGVATVERNLDRFDTGWWSRYDLAPTRLRNLASPFYHALHVVQLDVLHRLAGRAAFAAARDRWAGYAARRTCRARALAGKVLFKAVYF